MVMLMSSSACKWLIEQTVCQSTAYSCCLNDGLYQCLLSEQMNCPTGPKVDCASTLSKRKCCVDSLLQMPGHVCTQPVTFTVNFLALTQFVAHHVNFDHSIAAMLTSVQANMLLNALLQL